jgi:hypothetical protein
LLGAGGAGVGANSAESRKRELASARRQIEEREKRLEGEFCRRMRETTA